MKKILMTSFIVLGVAVISSAVEPLTKDNCGNAVTQKLPTWELSPPPEDLAAYAKQQKLETNIRAADFDGDGLQDIALLINSTSEHDQSQYVAVCLNRRKQSPELHLIKDPACGDGIEIAPKGKEFHNYETGKQETYPMNGISAYCFEKAGVTYLFQKGEFRRVIDSD